MNRICLIMIPSAMLLASICSAGQYAPNYDKVKNDRWRCRLCPFDDSMGIEGQVNSGVIYVTDGEARFGRDTGLDEDGTELVLDGDLKVVRETGSFIDLKAINLGLDARRIDFKAGTVGQYSWTLDWREIPRKTWTSASTPYVGTTQLSLPDSWVSSFNTTGMSALGDTSQPISFGTRRKRGSAGITGNRGRWTLSGQASRETKKGNQLTSSDFFYLAAAMPLPIDYETDELAGRVIYQTDSGLISVGYHSSKFSNRDTSLTWQNAYTAFNGETEGRKGLAPDNEATGWSLNGRYRFWDSTLTLSHRSTEMDQNEPFLPYTINASLTPADLPAASLNGEVKSTRTTLSFTRRLTRYLTVNIHGQVHERDNNTPILTMVPVLGDVFVLGSKQSRAYSFDFKRARIVFDYRLLYGTRLILGLQSDERKRTRSEIIENEEDRYWLKFTSNTFNGLRIGLRYEDRNREASPFQPVTNNNPLTVRYHQAARNQTSWRFDLDYEFRNSPYTISVNADAYTNDYPDSTLGLQQDDDNRWGVDLSYQPSDRFSWRLSHQKQTSEFEIFGSNAFSTRDWIYSSSGDVETTSVLIERKELFRNRLDLSLEYLHTDGADGYNTEFDSISNDFPKLVSKHRSLDFNALLRVRPGLVVKFRYYREEFDSADWALDQVTPTTLTNVLGMGLISPNYTISLASVSFVLSIGENL